jgi:Holliday junction resolvase
VPPSAPSPGSLAARTRQKAGDVAERYADTLHAICEQTGVAVVRRVSSHLRLVGAGRVVAVQRSTVDCLGVLRGGRAVAVEVKSCADGRLRLSQLPDHQRAELAAVERAGGVALVLVVRPLPVAAFAVPWSVVARAAAEGRASLGPDELAPWLCDPRRAYLARWAAGRPAA